VGVSPAVDLPGETPIFFVVFVAVRATSNRKFIVLEKLATNFLKAATHFATSRFLKKTFPPRFII